MDEIEGEQPDGPGLIESVWRFRRVVIAVALVLSLVGLGYATTVKTTYKATARIGLEDPPRIVNVVIDLGRYTSLSASFALTSEVLDEAAKTLNESPGVLASHVSSASSTTANVITLAATGATKSQANARLDAVAKAFADGMGKDAASRAAEQLKAIDSGISGAKTLIRSGDAPLVAAGTQTMTNLLQQRAGIQSELGRFGSGVRFVDESGARPSKKNLTQDIEFALIGLLVGLALAMAGAWIWADHHQVVDDAATVVAMLGVPLLGEVPLLRSAERAALTVPSSMPAPPFQFAASALNAHTPRGVLVISGPRGAGSTVTALHVASAAAREGRRVLVLDADNDGRTLSKLVGADPDQLGVADLAAGRLHPEAMNPFVVELGAGASFDVVPAGTTDPDVASLYRGDEMLAVFDACRNDYDLVVVDCPPLTTEPEASSLSIHADGLLLVVRGGVPRIHVEELHQRIDVLGARVVGFVFNCSASRSAKELTTGRRASLPRSGHVTSRTKRRSAAR